MSQKKLTSKIETTTYTLYFIAEDIHLIAYQFLTRGRVTQASLTSLLSFKRSLDSRIALLEEYVANN